MFKILKQNDISEEKTSDVIQIKCSNFLYQLITKTVCFLHKLYSTGSTKNDIQTKCCVIFQKSKGFYVM